MFTDEGTITPSLIYIVFENIDSKNMEKWSETNITIKMCMPQRYHLKSQI